ncbi:MAG: hypothetical protein C0172_02670, partial [Caldisphaera sp.]
MIGKNNKIYICSPRKFATGGTESLHQLCFVLRNKFNLDAYMYYYPIKDEDPIPKEYILYNNPYVTDIEDKDRNIVIAYEGFDGVLNFLNLKHAKKIIWFLSFDNYFITRNFLAKDLDYDRLLDSKSQNLVNFVMSDYLLNQANLILSNSYKVIFFMENFIGKRAYPLFSHINNSFLNIKFNKFKKEDIVVYNPAKGIEFTEKIIEQAKDLTFVPIKNMSRDEVKQLLLRAKVYIDFGNHPGRDRIPREAAICGCAIILGKRGTARYPEDVPVPQKYIFSYDEREIPNIIKTIRNAIYNYDNIIEDFAEFRDFIVSEENRFISQIK